MDFLKRKETDMNDNESCGNCKFFRRHPEWWLKIIYKKDDFSDGTCKRYPLVAFLNEDGQREASQPNVYDDGWCGEWK